MGEAVPASYVTLERIIKDPKLPPIMSKVELLNIALPTMLTEHQLQRALMFYNDTGVIFFSSDCYELDFIVLNPQWITEVLASVVTTHAISSIKSGKFFERDISVIWNAYLVTLSLLWYISFNV